MPVDFGIDRVSTARLVGRRPEAGDATTYARMYTDARVAEEAWPEHLRTADRAHAVLAEFLGHWERWGFGSWTVLADGMPIGYVGLRHGDVGGRPEVELLWFLDADHWGHGYATEMAREVVRVAFDILELDAVVAETVDVNHASRAVMRKLGMSYERDIVHVGLPHVLYRLSR
ncbi:GNAT family N-acetyltransferase [Baekduia sp.]|jgi:RimJ/RimL family protein N-acetyltransferase|uniref:GNAT family N-acetyltransferase n=1 Tax=Baekduia sp. TaxID=2600305 RepID=UPI002E0990A9|nr:GNAT family N-acetyltransferase [Baekduia sp.]